MDTTLLEQFRQDIYANAVAAAVPAVLEGRHQPSFVAEKIRQLVDTVLSTYESEALIPVHCPHPLKARVLSKIAKDGIITRTIPVDSEVFWGATASEKTNIINRAMIENGNGSLTDITFKQVGFSNGGNTAYIEAHGRYNAPATVIPELEHEPV